MTTRHFAVFLDVDGTLLEIAPTPASVHVPGYVPQMLERLSQRLGGALALVSGRPLHEIDQLFAPHRFKGAGVHGGELRMDDDILMVSDVDPTALEHAIEQCRRFVARTPGLLLEPKSCAVAIHFRLVPQAEGDVLGCVQGLLAELGEQFALQRGKCFYEIKPAACTKATAIAALMQFQPFCNRLPIFIGDDVTDEPGFEAVNLLGGSSIRVGSGKFTQARQSVPSTVAVHRLLAGLVDDHDWLIRQLQALN